jgi:uncharacterized protein YbjT (DUF2867 family)
VDVVTGRGLKDALVGVECAIDAASSPSPEQAAATEFFTSAAHNLQEAGTRAGVKRIVVISIIGIDRFTTGYMAAKVAHEKAMLAGPIPGHILRAAQFHELVPQMIEWGRKGDVSYLPKMRAQLVAAKNVAEALADIAINRESPATTLTGGAPIPEIAGPKEENLADAAERFVAKRGDPVRIEEVSNPADPDSALYEAGALLPGPHATLLGPTFDEWLNANF